MLFNILAVISGIAWTFVYVEAIRLGFKNHTYAMPIAALALNITWEGIYSIVAVGDRSYLQGSINFIWVIADTIILYTFFKFGRKEFPRFVTKNLFVCGGICLVLTALIVQLLFVHEFGTYMGGRYAAFIQNAIMSGLFISMFLTRKGDSGQSIILAVAKWVGTLAPTIAFGVIEAVRPFIIGFGIICSILDIAYIILLGCYKNKYSTRGAS